MRPTSELRLRISEGSARAESYVIPSAQAEAEFRGVWLKQELIFRGVELPGPYTNLLEMFASTDLGGENLSREIGRSIGVGSHHQ